MMRRFLHAGSALLLCSLACGWLAAQESSSFKVRRVSLTALASPATSVSYSGLVNASMVTGAVGLCPSGMTATLGFWSMLGSQTPPVVLSVAKSDSDDPPAVVLSWSGQAAEFTVYRSSSPVGVVNPLNVLVTTRSCQRPDDISALSDLLFYQVRPSGNIGR